MWRKAGQTSLLLTHEDALNHQKSEQKKQKTDIFEITQLITQVNATN